MTAACRINQPGRGNSTWGSQRFIALTSQERRGQAPGGVDQGKPQEMEHPPARRQKLPAFFHALTSRQLAVSYQPSAQENARLDRDNPPVGCAPRTMVFSRPNRRWLCLVSSRQCALVNKRVGLNPAPGKKIRLSPQKSPHTGHFYLNFFRRRRVRIQTAGRCGP